MTPSPRIVRHCLALLLAVCLLLFCGIAFAQTHSSQPPAATGSQHGAQPASNDKAESGRDISTQAGTTEIEEEENAQFKHSKAVVWISSKLGLSPAVGFWIFTCINFAIIAGFIYWMSHTNLVKAMRDRTATIQKGIEEARKASAEANARLRDVQERLAKLDLEVAQIRGSADADFQAEEQRIRQAAEEDAQRVIEQAKSEIEAMSKSARRELKTYAAELAVELARKNINVDPQTDAALVRSFASELGKDGK